MIRYCAIAFALFGCTQVQQGADQIARNQAKQVVNSQVAIVVPGVDLRFATDCIIDNASTQEIFSLARASVTGVDASSGRLITDIAQRPKTLTCILSQQVPSGVS